MTYEEAFERLLIVGPLLALLVASAVAASQPSAPSAGIRIEKGRTRADPAEKQSTGERRGTERSPIFVKSVPTSESEAEASYKEYEHHEKPTLDRWLTGATLALAVCTFLLFCFTAALWWVTKNLARDAVRTGRQQQRATRATLAVATRAADIAERALVAGQRAFVFAQGISSYWEKDEQTQTYSWRFRPHLENSGSSPTKNMTMFTRCMLLDQALRTGFDFEGNSLAANIGSGLLPPKTTLEGGISPQNPENAISPQDIAEAQAGRKYLYLWGWIKYNDVFPGTLRHITRFCWLVVADGDPMAFVPGTKPPDRGSLKFSTIHHPEGNSSEDEGEKTPV